MAKPDAAEVEKRRLADAATPPDHTEIERRRVADGVVHPGETWNVNAQQWVANPKPAADAPHNDAEVEARRVADLRAKAAQEKAAPTQTEGDKPRVMTSQSHK